MGLVWLIVVKISDLYSSISLFKEVSVRFKFDSLKGLMRDCSNLLNFVFLFADKYIFGFQMF